MHHLRCLFHCVLVCTIRCGHHSLQMEHGSFSRCVCSFHSTVHSAPYMAFIPDINADRSSSSCAMDSAREFFNAGLQSQNHFQKLRCLLGHQSVQVGNFKLRIRRNSLPEKINCFCIFLQLVFWKFIRFLPIPRQDSYRLGNKGVRFHCFDYCIYSGMFVSAIVKKSKVYT